MWAQQEAQADLQAESEVGCRPRPCEIGVGVAPRAAVVAPPVDTRRLLQKDMARIQDFSSPPTRHPPILS
ncbi:hypothetical protein M5D96_006731 [Drosophila gunungcola]|uniref:Uncharacterized protein n=1 Tax=Drosophila gunungcola TaxID=103775 RepID=A0A9P9YPJ7_9MUSC|nr:hypothetical protein M5D96_006731 [Drosophila gunungcola]